MLTGARGFPAPLPIPETPEPAPPLSLAEAVQRVAHKLQVATGVERRTRRGVRSRMARGLYVRGAAEALLITTTHMSRIITGRSRPGMKLSIRMAELAGCGVDEILAISDARRRQEHAAAEQRAALLRMYTGLPVCPALAA